MKERRWSYIIAAGIAVLVVLWVVTGEYELRTAEQNASAGGQIEQAPEVRYVHSKARPHDKVIERGGRTSPQSVVSVKSEVVGTVVTVNDNEGTFVEKGTSLATIDVRELKARRMELEARQKQLNLELEAATNLSSKGFQTELQLARKQAELASMQASIEVLTLDEERSLIKSPISGFYEERIAQVGAFLGKGEPVAVVTSLQPLKLEVTLSEFEVQQIDDDTPVKVRVGQEIFDGKIIRISSMAEQKTRAFAVELSIDNPDSRLRAGFSATVFFYPESVLSHEIQPSWLVLNDLGETGLKVISQDGRVTFKAIEVIGNQEDTLLVTGISEEEKIITLGMIHAPEGAKPTTVVDSRYQ